MHLHDQDVCATGSGLVHKFTHFWACLGFYNPVVVACPMHMRTLVFLTEAPCCQSRQVDVVKTAPWFKIIKDSNPWHPFLDRLEFDHQGILCFRKRTRRVS